MANMRAATARRPARYPHPHPRMPWVLVALVMFRTHGAVPIKVHNRQHWTRLTKVPLRSMPCTCTLRLPVAIACTGALEKLAGDDTVPWGVGAGQAGGISDPGGPGMCNVHGMDTGQQVHSIVNGA